MAKNYQNLGMLDNRSSAPSLPNAYDNVEEQKSDDRLKIANSHLVLLAVPANVKQVIQDLFPA